MSESSVLFPCPDPAVSSTCSPRDTVSDGIVSCHAPPACRSSPAAPEYLNIRSQMRKAEVFCVVGIKAWVPD